MNETARMVERGLTPREIWRTLNTGDKPMTKRKQFWQHLGILIGLLVVLLACSVLSVQSYLHWQAQNVSMLDAGN